MQTITPFLWFEHKAEEAAAFYRAVFPDTEVLETRGSAGSVRAVTIRVLGQKLILFNGGSHQTLSPAFSLFVHCDTQAEVDHAWDALIEGGRPLRCGWLNDRFGLSWQIVPNALGSMLQDPDPARAGRVMQAMLGMVRLDLAALQAAYDGP